MHKPLKVDSIKQMEKLGEYKTKDETRQRKHKF